MLLAKEKIIKLLNDKYNSYYDKNTADSNKLYDLNFSDTSQILENSSFLFYEFEDKDVEFEQAESEGTMGKYVRKISPLFVTDVIEEENNNKLLNVIDEEVPLYHLQPESSTEDMSLQDLSSTRDCGVNNVHSALRDSSFYQIWLRDVFGSIQNLLLLNSYNKLRWPVISENQYLTAGLFPSLALDSFNQESTSDTKTLIEFKDTSEENTKDNQYTEKINGEDSTLHNEIGCIEYLNDIIEGRLNSTYSILDYHPGKTDVIRAWGQSLYECGRIQEEDLEKELIVYKLQDIRYELLKRKYAGSRTLYNITLASLDRQGSLVSATPIGNTNFKDAEDDYFLDKRLLRVLDIPGVTSSYNSVSIYPLDFLTEENGVLSINDLSSIYYDSGAEYNAETFFEGESTNLGGEDFHVTGQVSKLRKNKKYLNWNCLSGISKGQITASIYNTLDEKDATGMYAKLDTRNPKDEKGNAILKNGKIAEYSFLDYAVPAVNISTSSGAIVKDILDISADRLLFSPNILQREMGQDYPYVTYSIANNNSISLLDPDWVEYIQGSIETKSKVQEDILCGAQLNKYFKLGSTRQGEYSFFAISYSKEEFTSTKTLLDSLEMEPAPEDAKYTYLWYCTVKYDASEFTVKEFSTKAISKITLKIDSTEDTYKDIEEYQSLKKFSKGILPFTYFKVSDDNLLGLQYGLRQDSNNHYYWGDDLGDLGYSKAYYIFSEKDCNPLENPGSSTFESGIHTIVSEKGLKYKPTQNTRVVYYIVKKSDSNFVWSSPIKVINLKDVFFKKEDSFFPDEYDLCYFLNPYLNFTKNSASPLRNKRVFSTEKSVESGLKEVVKDISDNIYLSNLTRFRGRDFLCCDKDESTSRWIGLYKEDHPARGEVGFYLKKYSKKIPENSVEKENVLSELKIENNAVAIYGDPRTINLYDLKEEEGGNQDSKLRGEVYTDPNTGIKCLHFESKLSKDYSEENKADYTYEYLKLGPSGLTANKEENKNRYNSWWWNKITEGETLCLGISLNENNSRTGIYKDPILVERKNDFSLKIEFSGESKFKIVLIREDISVSSNELDLSEFSNSIIRVGASIVLGERLLLIVNSGVYRSDSIVTGSLIPEASKEEPLCIGISSDNQRGCFLGNIYDIRLYGRGFSEKNLQILSQGSFREIYSHSPDLYILGYNNYVDLGIVKEVSTRMGVESEEGAIDKIDRIRAFNRSVWDSSLLERSPLWENETAPSSPFYREDAEDPEDDSDVYGWVNGQKDLKDCVEVDLKGLEALNNASLKIIGGDLTPIIYNGEKIEVSEGDKSTVLDTMIYPVSYEKDIMKGGGSVEFSLGDFEINSVSPHLPLPTALSSTDGSLKYEADLSLNFKINSDSNFTNFYSKGANISLLYNNILAKPVVVKNGAEENSSSTNHILIPLTVPRQQSLNVNNEGYFDRFYLSNVELDKGINTLLSATSYYNELRIPVAFDVITSKGNSTSYASKWDALRTLKEGTYYLTCKYPFQILPFEDSLYDTVNKAKYNYLYASVRFKIEVSGKPITYENGKNGAENITSAYKSEYNRDNIITTLKSSSALLSPEDNRSFPHREINIDLYVQDVESTSVAGKMYSGTNGTAFEAYEYSWKLLGSNHPDDYANKDFIYLTRQTLENALTITEDIPAFFSRNLTSPFFIAKSEKMANNKTRVNSASSDDDLIDPIRINPVYNTSKLVSYVKASGVASVNILYYIKDRDSYYLADPQPQPGTSVDKDFYTKYESLDNLQVEKENDLNNLVLVAGRSYKILWDYTGYISELSFTDNIYGNTSAARISLANASSNPSYMMTDSEKQNFARLVDLIEDSSSEKKSSYSYTENGAGYRTNDIQLSGKTSGYQIADGEYITCYIYSLRETDILNSDFIKEWLVSPKEIIVGTNSYTCKAKYSLVEYSLFTVSSESEVPSFINEGCIYHVESTSDYYYANRDKTSITSGLSLDESSWSSLTLGDFYSETSSGKIYRAGIELDNVIFKGGDTLYYVWNNFDKVQLTLAEGTYNSERECPQEGDKGKLYLASESSKGFRFVNSDAPFFTDTTPVSSDGTFTRDAFYFGNPYSRSSKNNYLLSIREASSAYSRSNITNSYYFPYVPTEVPEGQYLSASPLTTQTPLEVKISSIGNTTQIALDEREILKTQHEAIWNSINVSLKNLTSCNSGSSLGNTSGVFTALSSIRPNFYFTGSSDAVESTYVSSTTDDLISYLSSDRVYPSKNENILITRRGLYSNNLISNQDFDNASYWTWGEAQSLLGLGQSTSSNIYYETYVGDDDWDNGEGKDVCEVTYNRYGDSLSNINNPLTMKFSKGTSLISAAYEIALNIKVLGEQKNAEGNWEEAQPSYYMWVENEGAYTFTNVTNTVRYLDFWPVTSAYNGESALVVRKDKLQAKAYKNNVAYNLMLDQYEKYEKQTGFTVGSVKKDITSIEKETLYVDSQANNITVYAVFLARGKIVGSPIRLYVSSLSQGSDVEGLAAFDDQWYTVSAESEAIIAADTVAFEFACDKAVRFRITKAVVRKSNSRTHVLGLSDGLYTKRTASSASSIIVTAYHSIAYRNKTTHEIIPIQFNAVLSKRPSTSNYASSNIIYPISGLSNVSDFRNAYSLGYETSNMKIEKMMDPWKRKLYYSRAVSSDIREVYFNASTGEIYEEYYNDGGAAEGDGKGYVFKREVAPLEGVYYYFLNGSNDEEYVKDEGSSGSYSIQDAECSNYYIYNASSKSFESGTLPFVEKSYFHKYEARKNSTGIKVEKEGNLAVKDLYSSQKVNYISNSSGVRDYLIIEGLKINISGNSIFNKYSTNLQVAENKIKKGNKIIIAGPLTLSNARITALANCFDSDKFRKGKENNVAITNLQLISLVTGGDKEVKKILYEIEYPPVIYQEKNQHLSLNIYLHKPGENDTEEG